jgi:hypothetical protein
MSTMRRTSSWQAEVLDDREGDVVVNREVREEARGLEHHPHLEAHCVERRRVELVDRPAVDPHAAAHRHELSADQLEQGGFAAAAAAEHADHRAARDAERQAAEYLEVAVREVQILHLHDVVDVTLGHATTIPP